MNAEKESERKKQREREYRNRSRGNRSGLPLKAGALVLLFLPHSASIKERGHRVGGFHYHIYICLQMLSATNGSSHQTIHEGADLRREKECIRFCSKLNGLDTVRHGSTPAYRNWADYVFQSNAPQCSMDHPLASPVGDCLGTCFSHLF